MSVITSDPILIDGKSFVTKIDGNTATVVRTSVGKALTQTEKEIAGDFYNSTLNEINYAEIYNLDFGANYLNKLGASDEWMSTALTSKQYKDAFKKATGKNSPNITFASIKDAKLNWEPTSYNKDANGKSTLGGSGKFIGRYPLNKDRKQFDYLQVSSLKYVPSKASIKGQVSFADADEGAREMIRLGSVFLPMQPGLSESSSVNWNDEKANAFQVAAFNVAKTGMEKGPKAMMEEGIDAVKTMAGDISTTDIANYFAGQAVGNGSLFTRGSGKVLNPNLELLFGGPMLRQFNYNFRFTPREEREAREVKNIIKFFKKNMAPIRTTGRLFLKTPNVFKLKYFFKNGQAHPFLNKIKVCALKDISVDYTPDGSYMTYDDGSMTSYNLTMTFGELNPIYAEDYEKENDTNDMGF